MAAGDLDVDVLRRALRRPPARVGPSPRRAAVAALVLPDLELLFIRRAAHPRDPWSGHVSFPGGREDPTDATPLDTAVRETREELGVHLDRAWLLGELDELHTVGVQPPLAIRPFVFALPHEPDLTPNHEVAAVHRLGLDALLDGRGRGQMTWDRHGQPLTLPRVDFDGVRLWGLTLAMVDDLLHRLDGGGRGLARG